MRDHPLETPIQERIGGNGNRARRDRGGAPDGERRALKLNAEIEQFSRGNPEVATGLRAIAEEVASQRSTGSGYGAAAESQAGDARAITSVWRATPAIPSIASETAKNER